MPKHITLLQSCQAHKKQVSYFADKVRPFDLLYSQKLDVCCSRLSIQYIPADDIYHIADANFCRLRFCPMCQWRKSEKLYSQNMMTFDYIVKYLLPGVRFVFLTLTVPNVSLDDLSVTINNMSAAWHRMQYHRSFVSLGIAGTLKTLEVTHNQKTNTWHPHFHVVLAVPPGVWLPDKDWWLYLWRTSCRDPRIQIIDIRSFKGSDEKSRAKSVNEVSKYIVKTKSIFRGFDFSQFPFLVSALKGKRAFSCSGVFKRARAALYLTDIDKDDLSDSVHVYTSVINRYVWSEALHDYSFIDCYFE